MSARPHTGKTTKDGLALRGYLSLSRILSPLMRWQLQRRLQRGKELPHRYTEKQGIASASRPTGTLVWMHGVGLGEVLALRGLILSLLSKSPNLSFLVTSSTSVSAQVFAKNIPPKTIHQFLPLDAMPYVEKFLDHWRPDISIWAEQDLWPAMVTQTHQRQIPLVLVNARMNNKSYQSRARLKRLYADLYKRFHSISAQDNTTAQHMKLLGADVSVGGSLKTAATALNDDPDKRIELSKHIAGRECWLLASSHSEDEALAISAHKQLLKKVPDALLIIAPRLIDRNTDIIALCDKNNLTVTTRSADRLPEPQDNIYLADTFGEMGLWYRLAPVAFIGGSMSQVQGHNPWEAIALDCTVIHGPNVANFSNDYAALEKHAAAIMVTTDKQLVTALLDKALLTQTNANAQRQVDKQNNSVNAIADHLIQVLQDTRALA